MGADGNAGRADPITPTSSSFFAATELPYRTPAAMRAALKARLAKIAKPGSTFSLSQLMTQVAFDRLLARLFTGEDAESWVLKGAGALIARLDVARHSKDIDLHWLQQAEHLRDAELALRRAAARDLGDHFTFALGPATPLTGNTDGVRVRATALLGPTEYARFHVDLVAGQWVTAPPDVVAPLTPLDMPGLVRPNYRAYPLPNHIADKIAAIIEVHVRSDGGVTPSTRYRDLVDLALIASRQQVDGAGVRTAILSETTRRGLRLPARFAVPDAATWRPGYQALAAKTPALGPLRDFDTAVDLVRRLVDPVLAGPIGARWDPAREEWRPDG